MIYAGKIYRNSNALIFAFLVAPIVIWLSIRQDSIIFFICFLLFYYLIFSLDSYYFVVDQEYLTIRNSLNPFIRKKISIKEIKKIHIRHTGFYSSSRACLKVDRIKKTYFRYPAAGLSKNDWRNFISEIKSLGLSISIDSELNWLKSEIK